jgi:hypothetical protein
VLIRIITFYCFCDDFLKAIEYSDDRQALMSTAEVMTVAFVAAEWFGGCFEHARRFLLEHGYMKHVLSESRYNRRLHAISEAVWRLLGYALGEAYKQLNPDQEYIVDSIPVPVCDNIRISRSRLYRGEAYRGKIASKRRYFYGLRIHLVVTATGQPVEFELAPGAIADITGFRSFDLDLPAGATVYADKAYTDYLWEDLLKEITDIDLTALRKSNATRIMDGCIRFICQHTRKRIETTFSQIAARFGRFIRAVTPRCFELKCFLFVWSFAI